MRLAYVCTDPGVPVFGRKGCSVHVQEVIRHLIAAGADIDLFCTRQGGDAPSDLAGRLRVHPLPSLPKGDPLARERAAIDANLSIHATLRKTGPFDAVYERHALWSFGAMEYAKALGCPALLEVNAPLLEEQQKYRTLVLETAADDAVNRAYDAASDLLAVSPEVAATITARRPGRERVHVVPNGVDPDRFSPNEPPSRPGRAGEVTIGFVGTLKPWHGVDGLLEACSELPERVRILIVGDGPEAARLQGDAGRYGLGDATVFTGAVDPAAVPGLVTSMDVAVAPYPPLEDFYFSPLKILEYMAAGRAVVAAACGAIPSMIEAGHTGLLYPPGDVTTLRSRLATLIVDADRRVALGAAARSDVVERHAWRVVASRIISIVGESASHSSASLQAS